MVVFVIENILKRYLKLLKNKKHFMLFYLTKNNLNDIIYQLEMGVL